MTRIYFSFFYRLYYYGSRPNWLSAFQRINRKPHPKGCATGKDSCRAQRVVQHAARKLTKLMSFTLFLEQLNSYRFLNLGIQNLHSPSFSIPAPFHNPHGASMPALLCTPKTLSSPTGSVVIFMYSVFCISCRIAGHQISVFYFWSVDTWTDGWLDAWLL